MYVIISENGKYKWVVYKNGTEGYKTLRVQEKKIGKVSA